MYMYISTKKFLNQIHHEMMGLLIILIGYRVFNKSDKAYKILKLHMYVT